VFLVILLFALIPVIGGVIKGVGRLALRVTKKAAENVETLGEVIKFLNRVGEGDAVKWLNKLNVVEYQAQLIEKMSGFCHTMITAINQILKARVGRMLPERWQADLIRVRDGFTALQPLASKMIPQALKELDAKLRVLQALVYKGEIHTVATGKGRAEVRLEAEAYLIERPLRDAPKQGTRFPSLHAEKWHKDRLRQKYSKPGYPDLLARRPENSPAFGKSMVYANIASFSGEITAKSAREMAGSTIFRAFGNETALATAPGGSWAAGGFWGYQKVPGNAEEWRQLSAVLDEWNGNGFLVVLHLPEDLAMRMPGTNAWHGKIAEQFGKDNSAVRLENSDDTTRAGAAVLPASVINDAAAFAADGAEETVSAMKWVYVARPEYQANVEVLATLPAPVKKWKSFVAGMGTMLVISMAAVGSWQYVNRPNPLQAQLAASLALLPATLTPEQVDLLRQQTALPQKVIAQTQQQLNRLDKLPPGWSIDYSRQLVEQAQALWPEQAKSLAQQWQQQRSAAALPAEQLNGWSQGMMTLQKLSDRLNGLDEQKGKYITVSELKSVVFATMQFFNQSIPAEEQLRVLSQHPAGKPLPAAAQSQLEMHLKQLTARYAELKQQAEK